MSLLLTRSRPVALLALLAAAGAADAAITVYTTQAAFYAAVTSPGTDTFSGFSVAGSTPSPITRAAGPYGYTGSTTTSFFGAGTTANPWLSTNTATDTITFNGFTGGVQAAGGNFFGSDIDGVFQSGSITLVATDSSGSATTRTITNATVNSFLGFVSTGPLTSLTVTSVQPAAGFLWPTVDNLTLATAVPEPATYALMLAGVGLLGGIARRRRRQHGG